MKRILFISLLLLVGCNSSGSNQNVDAATDGATPADDSGADDNNTTTGDGINRNLKVLASNIVFKNSAEGSQLKAQTADAETVDTETKVLAENVVLDSTDLGISSDNVQDAFAEVAVDVSSNSVGTWAISEIANGNSSAFQTANGTITFNSDGSFTLSDHSDPAQQGAFSWLIYLQSQYDDLVYAYSVINNSIVSLQAHRAEGGNLYDDGTAYQTVPYLLFKSSSTEMSLSRSGNYLVLTKQ